MSLNFQKVSKYPKDYHMRTSIPMIDNDLITLARKYLPNDLVDMAQDNFRRSILTKTALTDSINTGNIRQYDLNLSTTEFQHAKEEYNKLFLNFQPNYVVHYCDTRHYLWNKASSAEEPYASSAKWRSKISKAFKEGKLLDGRLSKSNLFNVMYVENRHKVHNIKEGIVTAKSHPKNYLYPVRLHARSHLVKQDQPDKIRIVFGVSFLQLQVESMFFWPLLSSMKRRPSPMLWGYETLKSGHYKISKYQRIGMKYINIDWSKFDQRFHHKIRREILELWRAKINFTGYIPTYRYDNNIPHPTMSTRLNRLFDWLVEAYEDTPFHHPDGNHYKRSFSGESSGNLVTQAIDSAGNFLVTTAVLTYLKIPFEFCHEEGKDFIKVLGDDSTIGIRTISPCREDDFLLKFSEAAYELFGFIVHPEKSRISSHLNGASILGYIHNCGSPIRSEVEILAHLFHPERGYNSNYIRKCRLVGLTYANALSSTRLHHAFKCMFEDLPDSEPLTFNFDFKFEMKLGITPNFGKFPEVKDLISRVSGERIDYTIRNWPLTIFKSLPQ
eukprot:TRINITY_DN83212_c0_g1_i2.p1 TRINITY_DN83212_c0_g1~~TRINITY_DN83212_c0_g1_i2.p1  ORF type:complete len:555 (+),score=19.61 TRINITY_DN83212_c0_g1_i2:119-1783(+)